MLHDLFRRLVRHPRVLASTIALAVVLAGLAFAAAPPSWQSDAAVILLNPPDPPEITLANPVNPRDDDNPYTRFQDLSVVVDVLQRQMHSDSVTEQLKESGLDGEFDVAANREFYRGPIVDIVAQAGSGAQAEENARIVGAAFQKELAQLQTKQGTAPRYQIGSDMIVEPTTAKVVLTPTIRVMLLALGIGASLVIGIGLLADEVISRRLTREEQCAPDIDVSNTEQPIAPERDDDCDSDEALAMELSASASGLDSWGSE